MSAAETTTGETEDMENRKADAGNEFPEEIRNFIIQTFPGDDRAETGQYSKKMREVANQYLFVEDKLKEKYPSYDLRILYCEPRSLLGSEKNVFYVGTKEDANEDGFPVYVSVQADGESVQYDLEDAFIGEIMHSAYAALLLERLQQTSPACYMVETKMPDVYGDEYDENLTEQEVLDGTHPMWNRTVIYVCDTGADPDEQIREVTDVISKNQYFGSYQIMITEEEDTSSPVIMEKRVTQEPRKLPE